MASISTVGNATLIAYEDSKPILSTDPWFGGEDHAYFGSWNLSHEIPHSYKQDILNSRYVWFSHGHQDHLNSFSIKNFLGKKVLLADHVGSRIAKGLMEKKYDIEILPDREWVVLSKKIKIMCITTYIQDSILLIDVNGKLFINLNDAGTRSATSFIRNISRPYQHSYLLSLSGYGDADMINFYDKQGNFVVPPAKNNIYVGEQLSLLAKSVRAKTVIPFSSHHQYQRTDSIWAQNYVTPMYAYRRGLHSDMNFIPAFVDIDCISGSYKEIKPKKLEIKIMKPEKFGDNWSDQLDKKDFDKVNDYFLEKEIIKRRLGFINFIVGGKTYTVKLNQASNKGISFEVPRKSLMVAVQNEIFDDLLLSNFMKATLFNMKSLYECDFNALLTKYSDNGGAKTKQQVKEYLSEYHRRAGREYLFELFLGKSADILNRLLTNKGSKLRRTLKSFYYRLK
jgi:L-ascorbate metabolism protein UlaG (beta-lactamase superfamily)